ncbi:MAG: T9SS type A sorting domain-containing protein [Saprospiraceae bacterium]|nr:T9SS type A sorting domain-containing protein [Saprospiraceae bacterium]
MKKTYFTIAFLLSLLVGLNAQNVFHEDFNFAPSDNLADVGNWYQSGINSVFNIKVVAPGLEYPDYAGSGIGNCSQITNSGNGDIVYKNFSTPIISGAAYLSFLFRIDNLPSSVTEGYCIAFNPYNNGTNLNTSLNIKRLSNSTFNLGVQKEIENDVAFSNIVFNTAKTYLVVLKYSMINGSDNDISGLYVFETGVPSTEPSAPIASTTAGSDYSGQEAVYLNNNYAQDGLNGIDVKVDGIRVGTSWATSVLAEVTSSVHENIDNKIPNQVLPNPFQQVTKIKFHIPNKGIVSIHIYDASGNHCAELINGNLEEGTHEITWNAAGLPNGVYTCQIRYEGAVVSNKLLKIN